MGWALEHDTGGAGYVERIVYFNNNVFAFVCAFGGGGGSEGVWRRDGPALWTRTLNADGYGCLWNGQMWYTHYVGVGVSQVWRSLDGTNWFLDLDITLSLNAMSGQPVAIGPSGSYLRAATAGQLLPAGPWETHFFRRSTGGVWARTPAAHPDDLSGSRSIVGFDNAIWWSGYGIGFLRKHIASWQEDAISGDVGADAGLSVAGGTLFVASTVANGQGYHYYRQAGAGGWSTAEPPGILGNPEITQVVEGGDGELYTLTIDQTASRAVISRWTGSHWQFLALLTGLPLTALGGSGGVCPNAAGDFFFGLLEATGGTVELYRYAPSFALSPIGNGLPPQAMDVDGDGDALYLGLYNAAGQPVLVRVPLPLVPTAMGSAVFDPADGDAINVKCSNVGGHVAVSGNFAAAGNEQVEVSDDAGLTWTDIDRNAWGVERAQPILVSPDDLLNEVMVALATAQDITETFDGGATAWIVNNPGVGYSPSAMARLPGGDELVIGDAHAVRKVEYSPNRGVTLQDITGGAAIGNVVALEVA